MTEIISKRLFLEFNGLPGGGKTTLSNGVVESEIPCSMYTYNDFLNKNMKSRPNFLSYLKMMFNPSSIKLGIYALMMLLTNKKPDFESLKRILLLIICFNYYKRKQKSENIEIILVDQGIIQQITSILLGKKIKNKKFIEKILIHFKKNLSTLYFINIDINVNQVINRIDNRNFKLERMPNVNTREAKEVLEILDYNFRIIRKMMKKNGLHSHNIDSNNSIEISVIQLNDFVFNLTRKLQEGSK